MTKSESKPSEMEYGKIAYDAFCAGIGMPTTMRWEKLSRAVQDRYVASARAVIEHYRAERGRNWTRERLGVYRWTQEDSEDAGIP